MSLHTSLTRREALVKMAAVMVTASLLPYSTITHAERALAASAPLEYAQFLQISQKITGFEPLDVALSARYFSALNARFPQLSQHLSALYALSQQAADAQVFNQMARERGMAETIQAIVTAWYTGTVDPASVDNSQLVAYKEALMYRTVQDALIVPTWCTFGPLWWTDLPPGVTRQPSVPAIDLPAVLATNEDNA
ncbi:sugar dehydrogenase complex small subunit [Pluralibacter gergoviae]|uniref:sugar dehydrogenase complex small subunit n=1 Tax=Pluralibacter gergoviae TaxID=61647 RepID=UPI000650D8AC|nr:sugar dehydrogenase complex small subunit [Pluralibacter gergoviae]EKV0929118.1 dehydrogenase [Pluralibacter gergoviae]EKV6245469.1 dehydrogenase [Pluralibacter gergoviae]EKW9966615.1 dehydrogenase [Pluralibacter gergoviae]ELD4270236.1 dehydrogenase [Pluralibacter gergoviae]ELD4275216.1 dehydrogenase [Pluralibacter gergoviae]